MQRSRNRLCCRVMLSLLVASPLLALPLVAWLPNSASAQSEAGVTWQHHDWGRFPVGSWQKIRIVTETVSPSGEVTGSTTTERMTQIVRSTRRAVTLRTTSSVEVAGRRFETPAHDTSQGNHGEPIMRNISARDLGEREMLVEGRRIPCRVKEYEFTDAEVRKIVRIHYSDRVAPFVLRREEISTAGENNRTAYTTNVDVLAFDKPHRVLAEILPTSYVREVRQSDKATTTTLVVHAQDVPGGIVAYTSKETDPQGNLVRRSRAELVDYGFSNREGGGGGIGSRRGFRQGRGQ